MHVWKLFNIKTVRISQQIMENTGRIIAVEVLNGRYSVTVMSFEARFITVCASPGSRWGHCSNVWESLMIVVLSILVIAGVFKYRPARLYTFVRIVEQRKEKKGGRIPMSFA